MLKKYLKYIVIFFVLYSLWALVLPLVFRVNIKNIENLITYKSGCKIELGSMNLKTASVLHAGITSDKIILYKNNGEIAFNITKPRINLSLMPLILGKVRVLSAEFNTAEANLILDNKLYLGDIPIELSQKSMDCKVKRIKINRQKTVLFDKKNDKYTTIDSKDFYYKESANNFILRGDNKIIADDNKSVVDFNIRVPKKHSIGDSRVNFNVENFDFATFTPFARMLSNGHILSLNGKLQFKCDNSSLSGYILGLKFIAKEDARSIIFPEKVDITSLFSFRSDNLFLKEFRVLAKGIEASLSGGINNFTGKKPEIGLKINAKEIDARTVALMMPPLVVPQFNFYRLKMYPFYGKADVNLSLRGKLTEPCMDGNIHLHDAYMIKPIKNAGFADINVKCKDKKMELDVVVPAGDNQTVYVTGFVDSYGNNKVDLKIRSTQKVRLATAQSVLNPLHQILRFPIGPVPIMDVDGWGNINIRVIGTKKDPHIWGDFNFYDARASFNDIRHFVLNNASGNLSFNDRDAHFINNEGTVNGQKTTVDGVCTLFGSIDFKVFTQKQPLNELVKTLQESPMLSTISSLIPDIKECKNNVDLNLNLTGKLPNIYHIVIGDNLNIDGIIKFYDNAMVLNNIPIKRLFGDISFKNFDISLNLNSILANNSKIDIMGEIKDRVGNISVSSSGLDIKEFVKDRFAELDSCRVRFKAHYKGTVDKLEVKNIECSGEVIKSNIPVNKIKIMNGKFELKNGKLMLKDLYGFIKQNPFNISLQVNNISNDFDIRKSKTSGDIRLRNFELTTLNGFKNCIIFPQNIRSELGKLVINNGNTDVDLKIRNNKMNGEVDLNNINFTYNLQKTAESPMLPVPIKLINGGIKIHNNKIYLGKMNYLIDTMPVLVYGDISNIFRKPKINIHVNSKLLQRTFDKYWNIDNIYPIKVKGDILLGSWFTGEIDKINTRMDCKMESNSSIYYMGATIGDVENPIIVNSDFDILNGHILRLNKFNYSKLISSLNNKQNVFPLMSMKGAIVYYGDYYKFNDLYVKTYAPTDARIFNILFKKPTIKQGQFMSDLRINGKSTNPDILGEMTINGLDMPFVNTTIKDLSLDFNKNDIIIKSKGEVLSNNIIVNAKMRNKFSDIYYVDGADIYIKHLDINNLTSDLKQVELKTFNESTNKKSQAENANLLNSVIFKDLTLHADTVSIKNLNAKNLVAKCSVSDDMKFVVKHFDLDVSGGKLNGAINLNMLNNLLKLQVNADGIDSNEFLTNFFDLPNQMFGKFTGKLDIITNITNDRTSKETLGGRIVFQVKDGRMPKLGSLEYLLRAGNVFKSGITGITMNSVIELISPLKTGEFSHIDGNIHISSGIADKIEIHSSGKALSLFIRGKHNLVTQIADIEVLGQLSKNVSTILGAAGNISLNSLFNKIPGVDLNEDSRLRNEFNKIPGIELSDKKFRKFMVDIYGDINTDDNVKTFRWIN